MSAPQIFICYRRRDSNAAAWGIHQRLGAAFGESAVFLDHFGFEAGQDWRERTRPLVTSARAFVVVIDKDWLTIARERFQDEQDPVRAELEIARRQTGSLVLPVAIDDTKLPEASDFEAFRPLGDAIVDLLTWLLRKTALRVRFDRSFEADAELLIKTLDEHPGIDRPGSATGADVDGLRVTRPWAITIPRPTPRAGDRRRSELWILQAKYRATPLVGRESVLRRLRTWLAAPVGISARLHVGRAGAGKTRLGLEFLWEVFRDSADKWDAGIVSADSLRQPRDWFAWTWRRSTLLMIDYVAALESSLEPMLLALCSRWEDGTLPPLRLLLLEREASATEGWFSRLLERESGVAGCAVRELFDPAEPIPLESLNTVEHRRTILVETLARAAADDSGPTLGVPDLGSDVAFDASIQSPQWRDPLYLMMAALVARQRFLVTPDGSREALLGGLSLMRVDLALEVARKERRRLDLFVPQPGEGLKRLFRHMATCATLCGGLSSEDARRAAGEEAQAVGVTWPHGPGDLAMQLHAALPERDNGVATLLPDIVGEAFVLTTLLQDGLSRSEQGALIQRLARRSPESVSATLLRLVQDFGADDQRTGALLGWVEALIELGLETGATTLLALEAALPQHTMLLREPALRVADALYERLRGSAADATADLSAEKARLALNLAFRLNAVGRHEDALRLAEEAVSLCRALVAQNRARGLLAVALDSLASQLGAVGRPDDALGPAEEAVALQRALVAQDPDTFRFHLAVLLHNLATRLSEVGRQADALGPAEEAVALYRPLVAQNPEAFLPALAMALSNLADRLSAVGRQSDAPGPAAEAVALYRVLAAQNPDAFEPDLARAVHRLALRLSEVGRQDDALGPANEAVSLYRALFAHRPDAFRSVLARSLDTLGSRLSEAGRLDDAVGPTEEAVALYRALVAQNPDAFRPTLARLQIDLAITLSDVGRHDDALRLAEEAVALYRALVARNPDGFQPDLARSLDNLTARLNDVGRWDDALASVEEAVALRRALVARSPDTFRPDLALAMHNLAAMLSEAGRLDDAVGPAEEAVALYRALVAQSPDAFLPDLAKSLDDFASRLTAVGRNDDALKASEEAMALYRALVAQNPDAFRPNLAEALGNHAATLSETRRQDDALGPAEEAVALYRALAVENPDAFQPVLVISLHNLAVILRAVGRQSDSLGPADEAMTLYRALEAQGPEASGDA